MTKEKVVKSKLKILNVLILLFGGVAGIFFGIKFTILGLHKFAILFVGIPFLLIGVFSLYYFLFFDILYVTTEKIIFKSLFGFTKKTIYLSEIEYYNEVNKENAKFKHEAGHMKWKDLTLFGKDFEYKISSTSYSNYSELKRVLIKGIKRDYNSEIEWERKNSLYYGIGFLIFGIILFYWFGINSKNLDDAAITLIFSSFFIIYGIYLIRKNRKV
jgi:hypothetical protein